MFTEPFILIALAVGLISAGMCAYIGNYVLMKKMTFIAVALSEIAALGVALGFMFHIFPDLAALAASLVGVVFFWKRTRAGRATAEGMIGFIYVTSAALALIIISKNPGLEAHGIDLVSGNLLYSTITDVYIISAVAVVVGVVHFLFRRAFLFISFDTETARTLGLKASGYDLVLMLTIGIVIAFCMKLTGMLFVFASLVVPGMTALAVLNRVRAIFLLSVFVALLCVVLGLVCSFHLDLPTSPTIICFYAMCYLVVVTLKAIGQMVRRSG